ncbi:hypothetical protein [Candidatus Arsenophonus triatominarum]|nr:hypothetical protein [Candidatus Arsenophonus triatominarum]
MKGWQLGIAIIIMLQINNCYAAMLFFFCANNIMSILRAATLVW